MSKESIREKLTPMMEQYRKIKRNNKDAILLFRLGDFYEMFEEDARLASGILNIALTKRNNVPMCSFPYHAADTYISKLLNEGRKVGICEQVQDPSVSRGLVRREVIEVLSPGIITDPNLLTGGSNAAASICTREFKGEFYAACATLDVSTGDFVLCYFSGGSIPDYLLNFIDENEVREIIYPEPGGVESGVSSGLQALINHVRRSRPGFFSMVWMSMNSA